MEEFNRKDNQPAEGQFPSEGPASPEREAEPGPILETLEKQIEELKLQADEYLDSLQRERASFANYRKRMEQENAGVYDRALADLVKIFLPLVDDLERSLKNKPANLECASWAEGIELILKKLQTTLINKNIHAIEIMPGDDFDPGFQEAISHEEHPSFTDGQVIEVVQTGYKINDRIIRPALVRVAK
jgi:molecular chaperone GrpE